MKSDVNVSAATGETGCSPDQKAAHQFLTELRTRVATQALPYQHGVEAQALKSLFEIFGHARAAIKDNPGCEKFADLTIAVLNRDLRPVTAKWDRQCENGILSSRDGADAFREDLSVLQAKLKVHTQALREMAYGNTKQDEDVPGPFECAEFDSLFSNPIAYGIDTADQIETMKRHLAARDIEASGVDQINAKERATVEARRESIKKAASDQNLEFEMPVAGMDAVGLACSGGGVRSATFCLGVIQILADKGLIKRLDYLSTVSGGGFTGSFLTQRLSDIDAEKLIGGAYGPDPEPIRYLRQRAKYLTTRNFWDAFGMVTSTVAGMIINWMAPLMVIVGFAALTVWVEATPFWKANEVPIYISIILLTFGSALAFFLSLRRGERASNRSGWVFTFATLILVMGAAWKLVVVVYNFFFGIEPLTSVEAIFAQLTESTATNLFSISGIGVGGAAILVPVILRFLPVLKHPKVRALVNKAALLLASLFLPVAAVALYFLLCAIGKLPEFSLGDFYSFRLGGQGFLIALTAALFILTFFFLNINLTAPHRLYRNGLAGTFVRNEDGGSDFVKLTDINEKPLSDGTSVAGFAPYHLINAAVNLPTSSSPGLRERLCDFFLFSKHYTGSPVIGYRPTSEWLMNGKPADLASAMAISGAAFSSSMGLSSIHPLRALLTFLNVRLGFWIRRPHMPGILNSRICGNHPGFSFLIREMAGIAMSEKQSWVNLSDGGHIENLAVYELLRRRCKFIIAIDGECDPGFQFHGLVTLIRHARIDLGVRIAPELSDLRKNPETGHSRCHYQLCRVHYPDSGDGRPAATGLMLYIKLSTTGNESELIKRYQAVNPEFPHQTTMDQFFDEEQFEAYRQLGAHVGNGLFARCLTGGNTAPRSVKSWFQSLAKNLLLPE